MLLSDKAVIAKSAPIAQLKVKEVEQRKLSLSVVARERFPAAPRGRSSGRAVLAPSGTRPFERFHCSTDYRHIHSLLGSIFTCGAGADTFIIVAIGIYSIVCSKQGSA
jgi:hypothetical protein